MPDSSTLPISRSHANPKCRWLRFSIRGLLIVVTAFSIGIGWWVNRAHQQRAAVAWIEAHSGEVEYEFDDHILFSKNSVRWHKLIHNDPSVNCLHTVKRARISSAENIDRMLELQQHNVIPLEKLAGLRGLEGLSVSGVESETLTPLAGMKRLKVLMLSGDTIADISIIRNFKQLQRLTITESHIKDLTPLGACASLESVAVGSDQTYLFGPMAKLKSLEYLVLMGGMVDDFSELVEVESLQQLIMRDVQVTDWNSLAKMKQLTVLSIRGDRQLNLANLVEIQKALPNTRLSHDLLNVGILIDQ